MILYPRCYSLYPICYRTMSPFLPEPASDLRLALSPGCSKSSELLFVFFSSPAIWGNLSSRTRYNDIVRRRAASSTLEQDEHCTAAKKVFWSVSSWVHPSLSVAYPSAREEYRYSRTSHFGSAAGGFHDLNAVAGDSFHAEIPGKSQNPCPFLVQCLSQQTTGDICDRFWETNL